MLSTKSEDTERLPLEDPGGLLQVHTGLLGRDIILGLIVPRRARISSSNLQHAVCAFTTSCLLYTSDAADE